jgi:hypothetical protein
MSPWIAIHDFVSLLGPQSVARKLRLLKTTFSGLREEQPLESLPKTFRDVMAVASHLGLKYVWIDRLCIYQDSVEDWRLEASAMKDVYKGSYLNVSALGGDNDEAGLFHDRQASQVVPSILRLQVSTEGKSKTFVFDRDLMSGWTGTWSREPLVFRAWIIQERLLAPRVLHYGSRQLFWECRQQSACEIHPRAVHSIPIPDQSAARTKTHEHPHLWKQLLDAGWRMVSQDSYDQLFYDGHALVDTYTKCELTFASDRLIALSGVAEDMKHALNTLRPGSHRYLAGIWEESY